MAVAASLALPGAALAVTGGKPASRDYPYMAALFNDGSFNCGGTLVAPEWVLTAAHCISPGAMSFEIGGHSLGSAQNEVRAGAQTVVHPSYDEDTLRYDVALVRLAEPSAKATISLARPPDENALWAAGKDARVIGYGVPGGLVGRLFEADVKMVSDQSCDDSYGSDFDEATMVCAGELYGVEDACKGDSGGPLMVPSSGTLDTGSLVQVGVVSWGFYCGVPTQYGVYSRVADQLLYDWVLAHISPPEPGGDPESGGSATPGGSGTAGGSGGGTCTAHEHRHVHLHSSSRPRAEDHAHRSRHIHRRRHVHRKRHRHGRRGVHVHRRAHTHKRRHIHRRIHRHRSTEAVETEHIHTESHAHCA